MTEEGRWKPPGDDEDEEEEEIDETVYLTRVILLACSLLTSA